jgi:hypothetical protein
MTTEDEERARETPEIEQEIEGLRSDLGELVGELDRRRHDATDIPLQIRRHPRAAAVVGAGIALTILARLTVLRRRRADTMRARALNLARALALLSNEDPRQVRRAIEGKRNPTALGALVKAGAAIVRARVHPTHTR